MLRLATKEDFTLVSEMIPHLIEDSRYSIFMKDYVLTEEYFNSLINDNNHSALLIIEEDNKPIGFMVFNILQCFDSSIKIGRLSVSYIEPEYRGKGYMKEVKGALEYWSKKLGCKYSNINTSNGASISDYELYEVVYMKELK